MEKEISEELHQELTTFVDVYYTKHGKLPAPTHFKLKFQLDFTEDELAARFNKPLQNRGLLQYPVKKEVPVPKPEPATEVELAPEEKAALEEIENIPTLPPVGVIAAHLIADVGDKRSTAAKLKSLDLTTADWNGFLANPEFNKFFSELVDNHFRDYSTKAKLGLGKQLEIGELNAIKYYHEFTGEFRPQQQEVIHLQLIISQLMEVISRFLTSEQITQVADEIDGIIANNGQRNNVIETQVKELMEASRDA